MLVVLILLAGAMVAFTSVFLGIGGGILLVPLLPSFFAIDVHQAVATSVTTIFLVVVVNTYFFHRSQLVDWRLVTLMGPVSALAAFFAARISSSVDPQWILITLAAVLGLVAIRGMVMTADKLNYQVPVIIPWPKKTVAVVGGGLAGAASGFAGIGAGAILSPLMIILKLIEPQKLAPTANANMVFATGAGTLSFLLAGHYRADYTWGLIRLDVAVGIFLIATILGHFIRPFQNKMPFIAKAITLNFLLLFLIGKIVYMLTFSTT